MSWKTARVSLLDFIKSSSHTDAWPTHVREQLEKQGIRFKPSTRHSFVILTPEHLEEDLLPPWRIRWSHLEITLDLIVEQGPEQ